MNPHPEPDGPDGGKTSLALAGSQLYLFDTATGLHVFETVPEPSTWVLVLIGGIGGLIYRTSRAALCPDSSRDNRALSIGCHSGVVAGPIPETPSRLNT
jgi:hypothetical protein